VTVWSLAAASAFALRATAGIKPPARGTRVQRGIDGRDQTSKGIGHLWFPFDLIDDADAAFAALLASVIHQTHRVSWFFARPDAATGETAAAVAGRFEDVVFLRMRLDQRFQRFIEASQLAGLGAGEHLIALAVVGHDLAVFDFEVLAEVERTNSAGIAIFSEMNFEPPKRPPIISS
jgi:hypothetical protein